MIKNNKGSALATVIIVFAILMVLGSAILMISVSETRQVTLQENKMKSYYAARGGADAMASYLIRNTDQLDSFITKTKTGPATGTIDGRQFETYVTGTEHEFIIESISYTPDGQEGARVYLTMRELNLLDHAIFANQILDTGNNVTINGNVGTNSPAILFGNTPINGNVTLGPAATPSDIANAEASITTSHMVTTLSEPIVYPAIDPATFPAIIPNNTININTASYAAQMVNGKLASSLNQINIGGNTQFYVHGGGQVHLYISGTINVSGTASVGTDANTKLYLYYDKTDTITFNGTPNSNVTIYAPYARINYNGGGNANINGSFICNIFDGPDSNCTITQGTGTMADLLVEGVAGYYRAVWSN